MDTHDRIISHLTANWQVFEATLTDVTFEESTWRLDPEHWSLIEIVCHLVDEETEDFRARVLHTLETPDQPMPQIHPQKWVAERQYQKQNFQAKLREFLEERAKSIEWLRSLEAPDWTSTYRHPEVGPLTAMHFLGNWLAHDYLHIRQINRIKYLFLKAHADESVNFDYAGNWK